MPFSGTEDVLDQARTHPPTEEEADRATQTQKARAMPGPSTRSHASSAWRLDKLESKRFSLLVKRRATLHAKKLMKAKSRSAAEEAHASQLPFRAGSSWPADHLFPSSLSFLREAGPHCIRGLWHERSPISEAELRKHLAVLGLPESGVEFVADCAKGTPAQPSRSAKKKNLTGEFSTAVPADLGEVVMNWRVGFDSLSGEFGFHAIVEAESSVLLRLNHIEPVPLEIVDRLGRRKRVTYRADCLLVGADYVTVVEVKPADELRKKCETHPNNWVCESGVFHYVQAEIAFAAMGIRFEVVCTEDISWIRVQNVLFLRRQVEAISSIHDEQVAATIQKYVRQHQPCSITEVLDHLGATDAGPVISALATGYIMADLDAVNLCDPRSKYLCASMDEARLIGAVFADHAAVRATDQVVSLEQLCDPKHALEFGFRLQAVNGGTTSLPDGRRRPSERTLSRWRREYRLSGPDGLKPRYFLCGAKGTRTPEWQMELALNQISKDRASSHTPSRTQSHQAYVRALEEESQVRDGVATPLSYAHYCRLWNQRKHAIEDARGRGGNRLANAVAPHLDVDQQLPLGIRPFQIAHIDHCQVPSMAEDSSTRGQPWLTVLVDAFEPTLPLAHALRFAPPSAEVDALVIRDCIRRHSRVPEGVVSDGGPDFRGTAFRAMLAEFGIHWYRRATANGRQGQEVERLFSTFASTVCQGKVGFVPDIPNRRSIDRSKDPLNGAARSFRALADDLEHFLYTVMPSLPNAGGSGAARQVHDDFERLYGPQGIPAQFDLRALIATSVPVKTRGTSESSGVMRFGQRRFYSDALYGKTLRMADLHPRRDPEDSNVIYFVLAGEWRVAKSRGAMQSRGSSSSERSIASALATNSAGDQRTRTQALHALRPHSEAAATEVERAGAERSVEPQLTRDRSKKNVPPVVSDPANPPWRRE